MAPGIRQPLDTAFKQQRLKAFQPLMTPKTIILIFLCTGIVFLAIGIMIVVVDSSVVEVEVQYPDGCNIGSTCTFTHTVLEKMASPVYFYYKISGMYQNHRRYVKSRNDDQLAGKAATNFKSCDPLIYDPNDEHKVLYPCGLIAKSYFNDVITAKLNGNELEGDSWNKTNIMWESDRHKFHTDPFYKSSEFSPLSELGGKPVDDPDFIVWMRAAGLPVFKKLYRIKQDNKDINVNDKLEFTVQNNYNVAEFGGSKSIVISTISFLGGKNPFLGWAYITVSILCLVFAAGLSVLYFLCPR